MTEFDPARIFQILDEHDVDFVVIGAMAAVLQGAGLEATVDVDITAATNEANRGRLADALRSMDARLRLGPGDEPVSVPLDGGMLAAVSIMTLITRYGPFDVLFDPAGAPPYDELRQSAQLVTRFGITFRVAEVQDVIAMKRAAGRPKDAADLVKLLHYVRRTRS